MTAETDGPEAEGGEIVAPTTFVLTVGIESKAFAGNPVPELKRILAKVSEQLDSYPLMDEAVIRDSRGNAVGIWGFETPRVWKPNVLGPVDNPRSEGEPTELDQDDGGE